MLFEKRKKKRNSVVDILTGRVRRNADKGRCSLCLGEEDVKHILLDCKNRKHWRIKLIHDKWLSMNKEVACRKIMKITKKIYNI
jgi:hypothetical protein